MQRHAVYNLNFNTRLYLRKQKYQYYCGGKRTLTKREFAVDIPLFLPISLEFFATKGIVTDVTQIPVSVIVRGERYIHI